MVNAAMDDTPHNSAGPQKPALAGSLGSACADLVNSGRDTRITFSDGSTIVLKGVIELKEVVAGAPPRS
jgi:hypothetical protein